MLTPKNEQIRLQTTPVSTQDKQRMPCVLEDMSQDTSQSQINVRTPGWINPNPLYLSISTSEAYIVNCVKEQIIPSIGDRDRDRAK